MAISRMQQPRQLYGLGSFVKKAISKPISKIARKIVPKEIAGIMRVAAPFLPPGYREAAYLLGTAKQTGRISPTDLALTLAPTFFASEKFGGKQLADRFKQTNIGKGLFGTPEVRGTFEGPVLGSKNIEAGRFFTEGSPVQQTKLFTDTLSVPSSSAGFIKTIPETQGILGSGGKMFQFGDGKGLGAFRDDTKLGQFLLGGKDKSGRPTGKFDTSKLLGIGVGALSLIQSAKTPEEAGQRLADSTGNPMDRERGEQLFGMLNSEIFKIDDRFVLPAKDGGLMRTNYAIGSEDPKPVKPLKPIKMASYGYDDAMGEAFEEFLRLKKIGEIPMDMEFDEYLDQLDIDIPFSKKQKDREGIMMAKKGGRANLALGTMPTDQEQGLGGLPIEADMRYTGGFMPYGEKEKADDVPARLSKNEFVFTADAVRAAGGGSVQKGAQKMYNTMKALESKPEARGMA